MDRLGIILVTIGALFALAVVGGCDVDSSEEPDAPHECAEPTEPEPMDPEPAEPSMPSCVAWAELVDAACGDEGEEILRFNCAGELVPKSAELACGSTLKFPDPTEMECSVETIDWRGSDRHWYDVWWSLIYSTLAADEAVAEQAWEDCAAFDELMS